MPRLDALILAVCAASLPLARAQAPTPDAEDEFAPTRHRLDIPAVWASDGHARENPVRMEGADYDDPPDPVTGKNQDWQNKYNLTEGQDHDGTDFPWLPTMEDGAKLRDWPTNQDGLNRWNTVSTCTCESPCDLNTATFEDMARLYRPLSLQKFHGVPGDIYSYNQIVKMRPICNPLELATTKKIYVEPKWLPKRPRPNPGYLLVLLWGCGGNQGLQGTLGGRGGCCPVTASSVYCGLKQLFNSKALNRNMYTKDQPDPSCVISKPYTKLNPPPWCYVNDKFINFDEFQHVVVTLNNAVPTDDPARTVPISGAGDVKPERLDQFWNGPDADYPFTKDYMKRLGPNQGSRDVNFELERDKGWWTTHLKDAFTKFDANKDEHISEQEYLTAMGLGQLRGLPRKSYVRQPWERTRASTDLQAAFQKCITHHGADKCVGRHPVTPATVDIDYDIEDSKMHPDCVMYYSPNAYADVRSGEVCCSQSTWEWADEGGDWHPLLRSECMAPPSNATTTSNCEKELFDAIRGSNTPDRVRAGGHEMPMTSRRRAWQRVKSVSEKLQGRFERMESLYASSSSANPLEDHPLCGKSSAQYIPEQLWKCVATQCKLHDRIGTCLNDKFCSWVELPKQTLKPAPMPHPDTDSFQHHCRSVLDVEMILDRDRTNAGAFNVKPQIVRFDLRSFEEMKNSPYQAIQEVMATQQELYDPARRGSWPRWWREIGYYLGEGDRIRTVKSEPSNRTAVRPECVGKQGLMYFLNGDGKLVPTPKDEKGEVSWGGIHRIRQKKWYPRWQKKRNKIRCACYPPPLDEMPNVELYPGCAATETVCLTPPDWSAPYAKLKY